jgi:hypothetical protein
VKSPTADKGFGVTGSGAAQAVRTCAWWKLWTEFSPNAL